MAEHFFGGNHTEIKLHILKYYIGVYTKALKQKGFFTLEYIDACAGTGSRNEKIEARPLLGIEEETIKLDGSPSLALQLDPSFDFYLFIELKRKRFAELAKLKTEHPDKEVHITLGDANEIIQKRMSLIDYSRRDIRGVIFLDPYGLQIDWETLEAITATGCYDVWFLFSVSGVNRNTSQEFQKTEPYKVQRLDRFFGTDEWRTEFYKPLKAVPRLLFPELQGPQKNERKEASIQQIETWVKGRLESIFPYVEKPVKLPQSGPQLFSLFLCVSNSSKAAIDLAKKIAKYAINHKLPL